MSEMVERVARAIASTRGRDPDDTAGGPHPGGTWLEKGEPWWRGDVDAARAAIEAMREPTEKMIEAGQLYCWDDGHPTVGSHAIQGQVFRAMIDAALKD